jgi:hypothetical protein
VTVFPSPSSPYLNLLVDVWRPLPLIVYGSLAFVAGFLALMLPETLDRKLPGKTEFNKFNFNTLILIWDGFKILPKETISLETCAFSMSNDREDLKGTSKTHTQNAL